MEQQQKHLIVNEKLVSSVILVLRKATTNMSFDDINSILTMLSESPSYEDKLTSEKEKLQIVIDEKDKLISSLEEKLNGVPKEEPTKLKRTK